MAGNTHPATAAEISATLAEATESELEALLERYADDPRAPGQARLRRCHEARREAEGRARASRGDVRAHARDGRRWHRLGP